MDDSAATPPLLPPATPRLVVQVAQPILLHPASSFSAAPSVASGGGGGEGSGSVGRGNTASSARPQYSRGSATAPGEGRLGGGGQLSTSAAQPASTSEGAAITDSAATGCSSTFICTDSGSSLSTHRNGEYGPTLRSVRSERRRRHEQQQQEQSLSRFYHPHGLTYPSASFSQAHPVSIGIVDEVVTAVWVTGREYFASASVSDAYECSTLLRGARIILGPKGEQLPFDMGYAIAASAAAAPSHSPANLTAAVRGSAEYGEARATRFPDGGSTLPRENRTQPASGVSYSSTLSYRRQQQRQLGQLMLIPSPWSALLARRFVPCDVRSEGAPVSEQVSHIRALTC